MKDRIYFTKEYDEEQVIGLLTGEPSEEGEQNYKGYSASYNSFGILKDGEDFLTDTEVERVKGGKGLASAEDYGKVEDLYNELAALIESQGLEPEYEGRFDLAELKELGADEGTLEQASRLMGLAYDIISNLVIKA